MNERTANSPQELAETTSQVFLGVRIQCAKCHNHPYEKWTQNQYYEMSAFFARVRTDPSGRGQKSCRIWRQAAHALAQHLAALAEGGRGDAFQQDGIGRCQR